jgi:hypothetical protein
MAKVVAFSAAVLAFGVSTASCGDRAGDPVVAMDPLSEPSRGDPDAADPADAGQLEVEPAGLCAACDSNEACGAGNLCVYTLNDAGTKTWFCGRDCSSRGCPNGYRCVGVGRNSNPQCVPETGTCDHVVSNLAPALEVMRAEALLQLNQLRAEYSLPELEADDCLHAIAQDSAVKLRSTRDVLGKFESECEPLDPSECECGWSAESERNVVEFGLTWQEAIDESILDRALRDPDDSLVRHLKSPAHVRVGFGIVLGGDEAWTAVSFGRAP